MTNNVHGRTDATRKTKFKCPFLVSLNLQQLTWASERNKDCKKCLNISKLQKDTPWSIKHYKENLINISNKPCQIYSNISCNPNCAPMTCQLLKV
jgi:hypothetical protein